MPLVSKRDFVVAFSATPVPMDGVLPGSADEEWIVGSVSVRHPGFPERRGWIRGEIVMNGWHVKPLPAKDGVVSCGVTVVSITSLGGEIASAVLSMAEKEGATLIKALQKACAE